MKAYEPNIARIFAGETKRPAIKRDGEPQSEGNIRYRWVHLILAVALQQGGVFRTNRSKIVEART